MSELRIINASGTNHEIGFKIGKETSKKIKKVLDDTEYVNAGETPEMVSAYEQFFSIVQDRFPQYIEELRGMAEGAGVDFRRLMKLNLPELRKFYKKQAANKEYDDCTTVTIPQDGGFLIAHNEDGSSDSDVFLLQVSLPSGLRLMTLCYYGVIMGFAVTLTSAGLFASGNAVDSKAKKIGLPKRFISRASIEAKDPEQFFALVTDPSRAQGQNYTVAFQNKVWNVEAASEDAEITELKESFVHANHFLAEKLLKFEAKEDKEFGTFLRYKSVVEEMAGVAGLDDVKKVLSSHKYRPSCVCAHGKEEGDLNKTLAIVFFDTKQAAMLKIGYGFPCQAVLKEYKID